MPPTPQYLWTLEVQNLKFHAILSSPFGTVIASISGNPWMEICYHTLTVTASDANLPWYHKTFLFFVTFHHCENTKLEIALKGLVGLLKYSLNIIPSTFATCRKAWHASLFRMRAHRDAQTLREYSSVFSCIVD